MPQFEQAWIHKKKIFSRFTVVGEVVRRLALAIQYHLAPNSRKVYIYSSNPFMGNYFVFYLEPYILPATK